MNVEKTGSESFDIYHEGEHIGYIIGSENTLTQIDLFPEFRGNGYGKLAVKQYLEICENQGASSVETTSVISGAMGAIVQDLGFKPKEDMENHWVYEFDK